MASESPSNDSNNGFDTSIFHKATISYEYLHTNSTTHEFVYGAIAELVDNSRDAMANNLHIDFTPNDEYGGLLSILDDGCGMDRKEAISVVSFGHSLKRMEPGMIGQYGNGLKSGAMRIAKDFIMFTKKDGLLTCLLLSRTFHEKYSLKEVFVPVASFTLESGSAVMYCDSQTQAEMHSQSVDVICRHTPFDSQDALFEQFERISGTSGTLIILFNLRRLGTGDFELNFDFPNDIRLTNFEEQREEERSSLRAYLSILHLNPRMKIYLCGKKVQTTRVLSTLLNPYKYSYNALNLKPCAFEEFEKCAQEVREVNEMLRMSSSALDEFEAKYRGRIHISKTLIKVQQLLAKARSDMEAERDEAEKRVVSAMEASSNSTPLMFYFGLNVHHRNRYGCMLYNNGRLIEMYVKMDAQKENDPTMKCLGVVGVVDVPYSVLEPTHNKQGFANTLEYLALLRAINDHMEQYWKDINLGNDGRRSVKLFWEHFGYDDSEWSSECLSLAEFRKQRYLKIGHSVQCDKCLKWRHFEYHPPYEVDGIPENWCCDDHPNSDLRGCSQPEEPIKVEEGKLVRQRSPDLPAKNHSPPSGRGVERRPDSRNRRSSSATVNGNGFIRRLRRPKRKADQQKQCQEKQEKQQDSEKNFNVKAEPPEDSLFLDVKPCTSLTPANSSTSDNEMSTPITLLSALMSESLSDGATPRHLTDEEVCSERNFPHSALSAFKVPKMEITEENDCEEIAFVSGEQDGQILMEQMPQIWMGEVSAKDMVKKCSHCGASETTCWRISSEGDIVCNACKQYRQKWGRNRPSWLFRDVPHRRGGKVKEKKVPILTEKECFNCGVKATCKWRRDGEGNRECNACNVYRRTCGKNRPLSLRYDTITQSHLQ